MDNGNSGCDNQPPSHLPLAPAISPATVSPRQPVPCVLSALFQHFISPPTSNEREDQMGPRHTGSLPSHEQALFSATSSFPTPPSMEDMMATSPVEPRPRPLPPSRTPVRHKSEPSVIERPPISFWSSASTFEKASFNLNSQTLTYLPPKYKTSVDNGALTKNSPDLKESVLAAPSTPRQSGRPGASPYCSQPTPSPSVAPGSVYGNPSSIYDPRTPRTPAGSKADIHSPLSNASSTTCIR